MYAVIATMPRHSPSLMTSPLDGGPHRPVWSMTHWHPQAVATILGQHTNFLNSREFGVGELRNSVVHKIDLVDIYMQTYTIYGGITHFDENILSLHS